jgi:tetratricopeptide (TPR) repeat protein
MLTTRSHKADVGKNTPDLTKEQESIVLEKTPLVGADKGVSLVANIHFAKCTFCGAETRPEDKGCLNCGNRFATINATDITYQDFLQVIKHLISIGHINQALTHCQRLLTHFPGSLESLYLLGKIYLEQGQQERAKKLFDWILVKDPENIMVYYSLERRSKNR